MCVPLRQKHIEPLPGVEINRDELEDCSGKNGRPSAFDSKCGPEHDSFTHSLTRCSLTDLQVPHSFARPLTHYSISDLLHAAPLHSTQARVRPLHFFSALTSCGFSLGVAETEDDHAHLQPTSLKRLQIGQDTA